MDALTKSYLRLAETGNQAHAKVKAIAGTGVLESHTLDKAELPVLHRLMGECKALSRLLEVALPTIPSLNRLSAQVSQVQADITRQITPEYILELEGYADPTLSTMKETLDQTCRQAMQNGKDYHTQIIWYGVYAQRALWLCRLKTYAILATQRHQHYCRHARFISNCQGILSCSLPFLLGVYLAVAGFGLANKIQHVYAPCFCIIALGGIVYFMGHAFLDHQIRRLRAIRAKADRLKGKIKRADAKVTDLTSQYPKL